MDFFKRGLNGFEIKILALIFMTFDHLSSFLWGAINLPTWFNWIGRISAPLFIFMVVQGFFHTRSKKKYMLRLYGWSILMALGNSLINNLLPHPNGSVIFNNIFATMFIITVYLLGIEYISSGYSEKSAKKLSLGIAIMIVPVILSGALMSLLDSGNTLIMNIMMYLVPTPLFVEGGIIFIALGIGLYLCINSKKALAIFYIVLCSIVFFMMAGAGFTYENLFLINYQWLMIFALPFMLLYNGEKGRSLKYFFYLYYPIHCYILYALGIVFLKQ